MSKLVDPFDLIVVREEAKTVVETALDHAVVGDASLPFEIIMAPPAGARTEQLTVAGAYRDAIPIIFDPATRTVYPIRNNK
jgi:hypothetical protein